MAAMRKSITAVIFGILMLGTVCSASVTDISVVGVDFSDAYFDDNRVNGGEAMLNVVFDVPKDGGSDDYYNKHRGFFRPNLGGHFKSDLHKPD